jgi:hypothetical protein
VRRKTLDMNRVTGHPASRHAAVLMAFAAMSVAMTWPLAAHLRNHVLHAKYHWDAYTNTMLMGARVNALLGKLDLYESYFFAPIRDTIAFNENLFGLSLLFAPFYLLSRNPLFAYNIVLLLSLTLSGYFTFLLVRRLSGSGMAGFLAGTLFAFSPYALFEMGRIQLVATQWMPLFFLFMYRVAETRRVPDMVGLGIAYVMQVGTCLYYAMFMLPIAALLGIWLTVQCRPFPRGFWLRLAGVGLASGATLVAMVGPYFGTRKRFSLLRTESFAEDFDGKLSFLLNVHPTNKLLTFLHHEPATIQGAHEEIAFPTFTVTALCLVALFTSAIATARPLLAAGRWRRLLSGAGFGLCSLAAACAATLATRSMLTGAAVVLVAAVGWRYLCNPGAPRASALTQWFWALLLTLLLFLGLAPLEYQDEVVRGLYYYLHTGVPGFNGIRKVSRQAVMLMLCFAVLSGFGLAIVLRWLARPWARSGVFGVLLLGLALEVRTAPMALAEVAAEGTVPKAYHFIREQPGKAGKDAPIAIAPAGAGKHLFQGERGRALHNYLALYHGRRTLNGKSSWIPPVTKAVHTAIGYLPSDSAIRVLQLLGPQFLVVHTWDIADSRRVPEMLMGLGLHKDLEQVYSVDGDYVYEVRDTHDPSLGLLPTPTIDEENNIPLRAKHIQILTNRNQQNAYKAIDGNPKTPWRSGKQRFQTPGDWMEFKLDRPRELVAIDFLHFKDVFEAPAAFKIQTINGGVYNTVLERPRLRFYHDQVHRPTQFVMRVVFDKPVRTDRLRLRLLEGVPGQKWAAHEVRLWTPTIPPTD